MYQPNQPYPQQGYQSTISDTSNLNKPPLTSVSGVSVKNPLVNELKSILDEKIKKSVNFMNKSNNNNNNESIRSSTIYPLSKQKIFTPGAKAYFILNSLFQSFKKKNEFRLLQQKVHKIEVYHMDNHHQESKSSQIQSMSIGNQHFTRVTPHTIFSSHQAELTGKEIEKFIEMERFIKPGVKNELINQILKSISNLINIEEIMKCYQKLFTTKYCLESLELRELVEEKMIKKVLSLDFNSTQQQKKDNYFKQIAHSLMGFPSITQNILYFIGLLFDKADESTHDSYQLLYSIMRNNFSFNLDNLQQALQNLNNKKQIQALIKINTKENNDLIKALLRAYTKLIDKNPSLLNTDTVINVLKIAQTQAHYKLVKLASQYQKKEQVIMPTAMVEEGVENMQEAKIIQEEKLQIKTQYTLKFIADVIKSGCNLWSQTNQWLKTTHFTLPKTYLLNEISLHLQKCLSDEKKIKNFIIPHLKIISKDIQETSEIFRLWLRHLLKPFTEKTNIKQKYLKFTLIKKFILKGVMNSNNLALFAEDIYQTSILHAQLLFDIFALQKDKAFQFFKESIENQTYSKHFFAFLTALKQKNPVKFKEWLICADQLKGGDLFLCSRYALIQFMKNNMKIELAFNWVRDLATYPPSKFLVWILISLIAVLKQKKEFRAFRNSMARTLNLILIRTPCNKLCDEFKKHLPNLAQQFKDFKDDYDLIFADVSQQTLAELKRAHMQSQGLKF